MSAQRDIGRLGGEPFDLLVVGGGVYGAALALEGVRLGLDVALVDAGDFASGASSSSLKILHGGFRYLQQANLPRMRSSIRARRQWSVMAPALVRPLPCAIASGGLGTRSVPAMAAALAVNDLISFDRNAGVAEHARVPRGRMLGKREFAAIAGPAVGGTDSGGCLWWDVQALDTEALVLGLIGSAAAAGACLANYVAATELLVSGRKVHGVAARDVETGRTFEIRARRTIFATGSTPDAPMTPVTGDRGERREVLLGGKRDAAQAMALRDCACVD